MGGGEDMKLEDFTDFEPKRSPTLLISLVIGPFSMQIFELKWLFTLIKNTST